MEETGCEYEIREGEDEGEVENTNGWIRLVFPCFKFSTLLLLLLLLLL